jgi:NAD(P)-dependent dehydrogenase (short-subunit alcohol dehydrogenase family)
MAAMLGGVDDLLLSGKTCVVTGASSGIGAVTARELAKRGARVAIVCRDEARGERSRERIVEATGGEVDLLLADLSSQEQVRRVAAEIDSRYERIDVLVNNAGAIQGRRRAVTQDGLEMTFAVNHLAYFLLTNLLLPKLRAGGAARIVSVASAAHSGGKLDFDDLQAESGYSPFRAYSNSKLANILFTRELARRIDGSGVTANCLHPGFVGSRFGSASSLPVRVGMTLVKPFITSPAAGADTAVWLACSPDVEGLSGQYFYKRGLARLSSEASDDGAARRLWQVSEELTGLPVGN